MSEEEKEAIEYIKAFQKDLYGASEKNLMAIYIDRVWNYIDKLQKELKDSINARFELQRKIDKIKEALGDKNIPDEMILTYIETLASENNRLEDIEDRKVPIEYNNVFNKGVKSVEDKIRTKIKELEKDIETHNIYEENWNKIEVLKELLGDE